MAHMQDSDVLNSVLQNENVVDKNVTMQSNLPKNVSPFPSNTSIPDDCVTVVFSEMEFLPWDNPQNIVSEEVEIIVSRLKNNLLVILFLIGTPANIFNMAVFYKQGLKDRVNLCLFALSLADELFLVGFIMHHGEQMYLQFTTKERFGPATTALTNINLGALLFFYYVSYVLSAIIATERCLCIYNPLKFHSLLKTKTMAVIIIVDYILVFGLYAFMCFRFRVGCVYDPVTGITITTAVEGEFYREYKQFIDPLESSVFGVGLPSVVLFVVTTATIMTVVKLRQATKWRSQTTSTISSHELAVTKTLVVNSIFFIICMIPGAINRFSSLFSPEINGGRRHHNFFLMAVWINNMFTGINSTFNFCVYYVMGSRFRKTFWALFSRKANLGKKNASLTNALYITGEPG